MSKINLVEIGSCSIFDKEFDDTKYNITKFYHKRKPEFYTSRFPQTDSISNKIQLIDSLSNADVILLTIGDKGNRLKLNLQTDNEILSLIQSNLNIPQYYLTRILKVNRDINRNQLLIYFNSVCSNEGEFYDNHVIYAACKSYFSKLLSCVAHEGVNMKIVDLVIGQTKSLMCNEGQDSNIVFNKVFDLIDKFYKGILNNYNRVIVDTVPYK